MPDVSFPSILLEKERYEILKHYNHVAQIKSVLVKKSEYFVIHVCDLLCRPGPASIIFSNAGSASIRGLIAFYIHLGMQNELMYVSTNE